MKNFEVKGLFRERGEDKKFTKQLSAENENRAREKCYSIMGSKHKAKRIHISIESVKEAKE